MKIVNAILPSDNEILLGKETIFVWRNNPKYYSKWVRCTFAIWQGFKGEQMYLLKNRRVFSLELLRSAGDMDEEKGVLGGGGNIGLCHGRLGEDAGQS